jgi:hypothetical protein
LIECSAFDEEGRLEIQRCLNCGDHFDDLIAAHHALPSPPAPHVNILPTYQPYDHRELIRRRLARANGGGPDVPASR